MAPTRWKVTIEYNGAPFSGWQRQDNALTVQEVIEGALAAFCQQEIRIHVAGRTDAGVHAKGQVAHFDLDYGDRPLDGFTLAKAINAHLHPHPISVVKAEKAAPDFHARFDAQNKLYTYRIVVRSSRPVLEEGLVWWVKRPLAVEPMREAARHLIGKHDFSTFRDSQCQAKTPVRSLERLEIEEGPYDSYEGWEIRLQVEARSFLHHQVRNFAGTLAQVGLGKWQPEEVKTALEARDRTKGGPTAPPTGLYLMRVDY